MCSHSGASFYGIRTCSLSSTGLDFRALQMMTDMLASSKGTPLFLRPFPALLMLKTRKLTLTCTSSELGRVLR